MIKKLAYVMLLITFTVCTNYMAAANAASQWDFDHQVQFKQTDLDDGRYHLQVIAKQDVEFSKLATFLMRRSLRLCKSYGFKIEVLAGVEKFDDKLSFPNMIMPSLSANVECPSS